MQNRALFEENARLTDLAHMLLSSPNFSQFLDEQGINGLPTSNQPQQPSQPQQQQAQPQPQQQAPTMSQPQMQASIPKETPPNHSPQDYPMQHNPQMVMVPNQGLDVSALSLNNGGWNSGIDMNYANTPIFAVLEVPEPPAVDTEFLSGKSPLGTLLPESTHTKDEAPILECSSMTEQPQISGVGVENPDVEIDESDPAFALFADLPASVPEPSSNKPFEDQASEKSAPVFELIVENESNAAAQRIAHFCHSMEASFRRVSMFTSHLS